MKYSIMRAPTLAGLAQSGVRVGLRVTAASNAQWGKRGNSPNVGEVGQGVSMKVPGIISPH